MPSADAGNLAFVRTIVLNSLGKITPNITIFLVLFFFRRGPSLLCLSLHITYKAVGFQLSLMEGWLGKVQSCACPDLVGILKTYQGYYLHHQIKNSLKLWGFTYYLCLVPFCLCACTGMRVKGWRAGFLPGFTCPLCQPAGRPKARGCGLTNRGRTDRQRPEQTEGERRQWQIRAAANSSLAMSYRHRCPWVRTIHFTCFL